MRSTIIDRHGIPNEDHDDRRHDWFLNKSSRFRALSLVACARVDHCALVAASSCGRRRNPRFRSRDARSGPSYIAFKHER